MGKLHDFMYKLLPVEFKNQLLKGKISQGADGAFLFDSGILGQLKVETYSQHAQDTFIFNMIFGAKGEGMFLDIGANDPIALNNTYLFEKHGWDGLAFEPIASLANKWEGARKTKCYNVAVGDSNGQVQFTESKDDVQSYVGHDADDTNGVSYMVSQICISDFLNNLGITNVDVAFIDVENYEMNVLSGIDFEKTNITCICIENRLDEPLGIIKPQMDIRNYIINKGYRLVARLRFDDIFLKENYFEKCGSGGI